MKFTSLPTLTSLGLLAGLGSASILINPAAQGKLPTIQAATASAATVGLNLDDIQADILIGMKKNQELFFFFSIANATDFKAKLASDILPLVTSTTQVLNVSAQPATMLNIAFSATGLTALNVSNALGDTPFGGGQLKNIASLGDPGTTNWVPQFIGTSIHGVILLASNTVDNINSELASLQSALGDSITEVYSLQAAARPGAEQGHEREFPSCLPRFQTPLPGQAVVPTGEILVGETGDSITRPAWTKDGSFLVFRQLKQLVPEFNKFLTDNPINEPSLTPQQGSDLLGARMIGRWKSGAPVFLAPLVDDPVLGSDPTRNNNFTCPFSAHIRKTRPRLDLGSEAASTHHIVRGGIPYGPEVTADEAASNTTSIERGLAFVSYQSNIAAGFQFLQQFWADNVNFVHGNVGFDPIIGANSGNQRVVNGLDPTNPAKATTLTTDFVVSRGGEYFFSPSLSAIANTLSV
nr:DyP-type peroxidase [Mycena epipterygia]